MKKIVVLFSFCLLLQTVFAQNSAPLKDCRAEFSWMANGLTMMFHDASAVTQGGPINSWFWTFGDGTTSTQQHPTKTYTNAGTYSVKLTIGTVGGCNDSQTYSVTTCQLTLTTTNGVCTAAGQVPVAVNVTNQLSSAGNISFNLDGTALVGNYPVTPQSPVNQSINVVGDGLSHILIATSNVVAGCSATKTFTVADCGSNCFLGSLNITPSGGTIKTVTVNDNFFSPVQTTIVLGDVVRFQWIQGGHTSTSDATTGVDAWNSGNQNAGFIYNVNLKNPGLHRYYCQPHGGPNGAGMAGSIVANCPPNNLVPVTIAFNTTQANAAGYLLFVDNVQQGAAKQYSGVGANSTTYNLPGDGQIHTVKIQDVTTATCSVSKTYQTPNCGAAPQCQLSATTSTPSACNAQNQVSVNLTVNAINGGASGFNVLVNNSPIAGSPFTYNPNGATTVNNVLLIGNGQSQSIVIQDIINANCNATLAVMTPNCNLPCSITNLIATSGSSTTHTIEVKDFEFAPKFKTITLGDVVKFQWTGAVAHTSQSDTPTGANTWNSSLLNTGANYNVTLTTNGVYPYYCAPHGAPNGVGMSGALTVVPNCNNGNVAVNVNFAVTNPGASGYNIKVDGVLYTGSPFQYAANGNTSNIVNIIGNGQAHTVEIQDVAKTTCLVSTQITTANCNFTPPCNLALQLAQAGNCSPQNKVPYHIMVTPQNAGNQGFNIKIDNVLLVGSPFAYNGSTMVMMMIDLPGDGLPHTVLVEDKATPTCKAMQNVTTPNCTVPCSISNLILTNNTNSITHTIEVQDFKFMPKEITVNKGDVVKFVWTGQVAHTATSDATTGANTFDSGLIGNGATYSVTMTAAGAVPYYCKPHGAVGGVGMAGKITVIEPCNNNQVSVNVKFNQNSGSQNGYKVLIDNILVSQNNLYNAQNPTSVNVNITGNGQAHTVKIEDMATVTCSVSGTITTPNCNANPPVCNLDLQQVTLDTCIGNQVKITLKVKNTNTATSQGFNVFLNNSKINNTPFVYATNGVTMVNFNTQGNGNQAIIEVRDVVSAICKDTANVILPNCTVVNLPCLIENLILSTAPTTHTVEVRDYDYFPKNIDVVQGDTVKFVWTGQVKHTATSNNFSPNGAQGWNSGLLSNGSTYKIVMTTLGANGYYCIPHGGPNGIGQSGMINVLPLCDAAENVKVKVKFTVTKGSAQGYKMYVDGQLISPNPFIYNNLQGQNQNLISIKGDGQAHTVTLQDWVTNFCAATEFITTPVCNAPCALMNLTVTPSKNEKKTVLVKDFEFSPKLLACHVGDTILFDFVGQIPHTVTSDKISGVGSFDSGLLSQGAKYQLVISNQGTHKYYCKPHGGPNGIGMAGEIMAHALCENGKVHANVEFNASGSHSSLYNLFIDGKKENQTPLSMSNGKNMKSIFIIGDGKQHTIKIEDNQNANCNASAHAKTENCGNSATCNISLKINQLGGCDADKKVPYNLEVTCEDLGKTFDVLIDGLLLVGSPFPCPTNGNSMTIPLKINGDGKVHFIKIQSITNPLCSEMKTVQTPQCLDNCSLTNLKITNIGFYQRHKVEVKDFEFSPKNLNATVGDTIDFVFTGQIPHTVTSDSTIGNFIFDSGTLSQGAVYQLFVKSKGDISYYCKPHGAPNGVGMAGKILAKNLCETDNLPVSVYFEGGKPNQTFKATLDNKNITPSPITYNAFSKNKIIFNLLADSLLHTIKIIDTGDTTCTTSLQFRMPDCADPCTVVQPDFTYTIENNKTVKFTNTTLGNATKWLWGFGDGATSTLKNPTYQYSNTGSFDVCLLAHATLTQCLSEPICKTISVQLVDNEDVIIENNIVIYPNPTDGVLYIKNASNVPYTVFNTLGQVLLEGNTLSEHLDLQDVTSGVYFLKIGNKVWRVVKE
jgi:plastocyanin